MKRYLKVQLVEVNQDGSQRIIEESIRQDDIKQSTIDSVVKQRKKSSGLSNISFTSVVLNYAAFPYLSHHTK